jgi:hypothetical protein
MGIDTSAHISENSTPDVGCCLPAIHLGYHGAHRALVSQMLAWLIPLNLQHIIVDANHVWYGFVTSGDPDAFFQDVTKNTFKNALYLIETLVGDAIIVSRTAFTFVKPRAHLHHRLDLPWLSPMAAD